MWLWILIGLNIIAKVHGFSSGDFPESCTTMLPHHLKRGALLQPQKNYPPFKLSCDKPRNQGDPITVFLQSKSAAQFRGFMLEAHEINGGLSPVGKFILLDHSITRLLSCNGLPDSAVSNRNNQRKSWLQANWTAQGAAVDITFRATFLEEYDKFWDPVHAEDCQITTPTPSTQPSTTTSTELSTTSTQPSTTTSTELSTPSTQPSTTTSTELSTISSTPKSNSTEPSTTISTHKSNSSRTLGESYFASFSVSSFNSFSLGLKMALSNILIIALHNAPFSRRLNKVSQISCSLLSAALEISSMVLFCVAEPINVTLVALVCVAIVINFIELVILCLPIGPSHELKEICDHAVKVCSVIHQILTIAVVFVGVSEHCRNNWLLKVMIAFTVFLLLDAIWLLVINTQRKAIQGRSKSGSLRNSERWRQRGKEKKLGTAERIVIAVSAIFICGNLCFAVVVAVSISGCEQE